MEQMNKEQVDEMDEEILAWVKSHKPGQLKKSLEALVFVKQLNESKSTPDILVREIIDLALEDVRTESAQK